MAAFCQRCGAKLQEGSKFCPECGTNVAPEPMPTEPTPQGSATTIQLKRKTRKRIMFLAAVAVLLLLYCIGKHDEDKDAELQKAALAGHPPSTAAYADTSLVHWQLNSESGEYAVYLAGGSYCGNVSFRVANQYHDAAYEVEDPVGKTLKQSESERWHDFRDLDSARMYLWNRCKIIELVDRDNRAHLAPGETMGSYTAPTQPNASAPTPVSEPATPSAQNTSPESAPVGTPFPTIHNTSSTACGYQQFCTDAQFEELRKDVQRQWTIVPEPIRKRCGSSDMVGELEMCIYSETLPWHSTHPNETAPWEVLHYPADK